MNSLTPKVIIGFGKRLLFSCALLFIPANTLAFPYAWAFLAVYFLPQAFAAGYFLRKNPKFIERRLKLGPRAETRPRQKLVIWLLMLCFCMTVTIASFDHRFGWSHIPAAVGIVADVAILVGMAIQFRVFLENSFASATIEIAAEQCVITTGPYALVRHPMYSGALLADCCIPLALGSWWALPPALVKVLVIVLRLLDEEEFLCAKLPGYIEYSQKVPQRLIPGIW